MMLVSFAAQLVASLAGGATIARFGYSAMLACARRIGGGGGGGVPHVAGAME
jgi:hypothetical protein